MKLIHTENKNINAKQQIKYKNLSLESLPAFKGEWTYRRKGDIQACSQREAERVSPLVNRTLCELKLIRQGREAQLWVCGIETGDMTANHNAKDTSKTGYQSWGWGVSFYTFLPGMRRERSIGIGMWRQEKCNLMNTPFSQWVSLIVPHHTWQHRSPPSSETAE